MHNVSASGIEHLFDLSGRVAIITGGAGLLGAKHGEAIAKAGGSPVLLDVNLKEAELLAKALSEQYGVRASAISADITDRAQVKAALETVIERYQRVDILINNAANNPKVISGLPLDSSRFETFSLQAWQSDIAVGLTGSFLCSQIFGAALAQRGGGVIVMVASDLAVIAPDQRLYRRPGLHQHEQPVKPVTDSVVKTGLIGLMRYLATYWAESGVRVNAISPGGVRAGQDESFVQRVSNLIPLGRMANADEYEGAIVFLCSDASSYMTGSNLIIDGGRSCW